MPYPNLYFLTKYTAQYDVILSDLETSWLIPTFSGKVIASRHPLYWVDDCEARRNDLNNFFKDTATKDDRIRIIKEHKVGFLLLKRAKFNDIQSKIYLFESLGKVIYLDSEFILIKTTISGNN